MRCNVCSLLKLMTGTRRFSQFSLRFLFLWRSSWSWQAAESFQILSRAQS